MGLFVSTRAGPVTNQELLLGVSLQCLQGLIVLNNRTQLRVYAAVVVVVVLIHFHPRCLSQ